MIKEFSVQSKIHGGELTATCSIKDNGVAIRAIKDMTGKGPVFIPVSDELIEEVKLLVSIQLAG